MFGELILNVLQSYDIFNQKISSDFTVIQDA